MAVTLFFAAALLLAPIAIDQIYMADTVLLAHIGWRGVNGLSPVVDYPHFYGGFLEFFVTASFRLFGVAYKSINIAFFMIFMVSAAMVWALCHSRLKAAQIGLLVALAAALIISLYPVEVPGPHGTTHAFVYNHVGIVLTLALTVFTCVALENRHAEWISAIAAGMVLSFLLILKTTFGLIGPAVILGCLIQKRWASAGLVLVGATVTMVLVDPGMTRALASLQFLLASQAADQAGGIEGRIREARLMVQAQALPVLTCLMMSFLVVQRSGPRNYQLLVSLFFCGLGYGAAMLATGGYPTIKMVPFLTIAALLLSRCLTNLPVPENASERHLLIIRAIPIVLGYSLIIPAILTAGKGLSQAVRNVEAPLVTEGPLAGYMVVHDAAASHSKMSAKPADRLVAAVRTTLTRIRSGERTDWDMYVMFADGVNLLRQVPDVPTYGIITNSRGFDFTAALKAEVVVSYPVWPTARSIQSAEPLGSDVDLVMVLDKSAGVEVVTGVLKTRMREEFRPCRRSAFWTLYARRTLRGDFCATPPSKAAATPATLRSSS